MDSEREELLAGGNASGAVTRVGDTVRKPWLPTTPRMVAYLAHLESAGFDVPRVHGRDEHGRLVLDYIPGTLAIDQAPLDVGTVRVPDRLRALGNDVPRGARCALGRDHGVHHRTPCRLAGRRQRVTS